MSSLKSAGRRRPRVTELKKAMQACRMAFLVVALLSLLINVLMLTSPLYMQQTFDRVLSTGRLETLWMLTGIAGLALLLLGALDSLRASITVRVGCWLNEVLGPVLLASSVRSRLQGDPSGSQPLRDLTQVQSFIASQGLSVFFDAPWVPIFIALLWVLHPAMGMLATGAAVLLFSLSIANELLTRKPTTGAQNAQIVAHQHADAAIRNAEVVQAMGMLPAMIDRFQSTNGQALESVRRASERNGTLVGATKFIRFFVQIGILGLGATLVLRGELTGGGMIAGSVLLARALAPIEMAMGAWRNFTNARISYHKLEARLQTFPAEVNRTRLPAPRGEVRVTGLTFQPANSRTSVLDDVSFDVEPGEAVAVIGPSASGKSTLCRLLVGITPPTAGEVRLDGFDLRHWDLSELGPHIGYLPQDVELFAGTVRENIARMRSDGDDAAVISAAQLGHAHEMIQRLPDGYDTQIGDGGARLSGGQRQRIGLARAVYGDPRLIILDEPNANLDQAGEAALAAAVSEMKQRGAALIIVGHRPSTIASADKILMLKDGRVEIFGTRDEVLQRLRKAASAAERRTAVEPGREAAAAPAPAANADDGTPSQRRGAAPSEGASSPSRPPALAEKAGSSAGA